MKNTSRALQEKLDAIKGRFHIQGASMLCKALIEVNIDEG